MVQFKLNDMLYPAIFLFCAVAAKAEVFSSTSDLKDLYHREASLLQRLGSYIKDETKRLSLLSE
jgi:hypothetical protein